MSGRELIGVGSRRRLSSVVPVLTIAALACIAVPETVPTDTYPPPSLVPTETATPTSVPTHTPVPSHTPIPTTTPVPTKEPTNTPTVTPSPVPPPIPLVRMEDDGRGNRWCNPGTVRAGRIVMDRAIGRWPTQEEAYAAIDDTWPPYVANGQQLEIKPLVRSEVQWHTSGDDDPKPGWGFSATVEVWLDPGVYEIVSQWLHDLKTCTLTVIEP